MNKILNYQRVLTLTLPLLTWFVITTLGIGHQSLTHLIEIPIVFVISVVVCFFITEKNFKFLLPTLILLVILLRLLIPFMPE